jgi:5'(3')-deoxyribonucleotidase
MATIHFDLDGVLAHFDRAAKISNPDAPGFFLALEPDVEGVRLFRDLLAAGHDCLFASTSPWASPHAWTEKRLWVERHFGAAGHKRLQLTHRKDLLRGDFLIDDRTKNGAGTFRGTLILFGQPPHANWAAVRLYFEQLGML